MNKLYSFIPFYPAKSPIANPVGLNPRVDSVVHIKRFDYNINYYRCITWLTIPPTIIHRIKEGKGFVSH